MEGLLPIVIEICMPAVVILIGWVVRRLVKKFKVQEFIKQEDLIEKLVFTAVMSTEKIAKVMLEKHQKRLDSAEKLARAIGFVETEMKRLGLTEMATHILAARIESELIQLEGGINNEED